MSANPHVEHAIKRHDHTTPKKRRRARGEGSVYPMGRVYWISYRGVDGQRHAESSHSPLSGFLSYGEFST